MTPAAKAEPLVRVQVRARVIDPTDHTNYPVWLHLRVPAGWSDSSIRYQAASIYGSKHCRVEPNTPVHRSLTHVQPV